MIDVKHLSKSFGEVEVLKDINETIEKGEKVVIVGPSGSGKSTFLRCLNLMEKPTSGDIFFEGENITQANEHEMNKLRQRMGMVFQHFNLFPHLTIKKNITLAPVKLGLMTADEADKKAEELLERVGLPDGGRGVGAYETACKRRNDNGCRYPRNGLCKGSCFKSSVYGRRKNTRAEQAVRVLCTP